ncbi:MAG: metal ABC transporter ATP-binding protein [Candidatus Paceibacterota bacterium]|jgi:zinc transport system ATP-binding protein
MKSEPLLKVDNLAVTIGTNHILKNVSFELHKEQVLAIIGPNGAGKSILLKTLLGLFPLSHGSFTWAPGVTYGYLPQRFHIDHYLPMTVEEFLRLKPNPKYSLSAVLELVEIERSWLHKNLSQFSSGQLQKILLAWAIIDQPQVLLFDEPTENVDVVSQKSIYDFLHHLQDTLGISLVIISHDLNVVYRYANWVVCLNHAMTCHGEPREVLSTQTLSELYGDRAFFHHHHFDHHA